MAQTCLESADRHQSLGNCSYVGGLNPQVICDRYIPASMTANMMNDRSRYLGSPEAEHPLNPE
jgi:hypothetical protein